MHEDAIRVLVREALARHLAPTPSGASCDPRALTVKSHPSHGKFVFLAPVDPDAPCVVEPQVRCHHCGFCQSYGH